VGLPECRLRRAQSRIGSPARKVRPLIVEILQDWEIPEGSGKADEQVLALTIAGAGFRPGALAH